MKKGKFDYSHEMPYNRAVNVIWFAYHYFTIKPELFEARAIRFIREIRPPGRISPD